MNNKNQQERLRSLSLQLTQALTDGDEELAESLQDEIYDLEEEINDDDSELYKNRHAKQGWA